MYCKYKKGEIKWQKKKVLIVAKCIVNEGGGTGGEGGTPGINSSKVYCKFFSPGFVKINLFCINSSKVYCKSNNTGRFSLWHSVLIVAKCIVNIVPTTLTASSSLVLIVAKCIVHG